MHQSRICTLVITCLAGAFTWGCSESGAKTPAPVRPDEVQSSYTGLQVAKWDAVSVDGKPCLVSPMINFGKGVELNHHRITVTYSGGSVDLSLAHSAAGKLAQAIEKPHLHSKLRAVKSGVEQEIVSPYRGEKYAWIILRASDRAKITSVVHTCWKGKGTLYGHGAGEFKFAGGVLPFRMMLPRNYDPRKKYPLVLSVSGSGGVGEDNARSMEMVILARHLFTDYFDQKEFECISLVTQIPSGKKVPAPYWPKGKLGQPTPTYHPDWPAVNENGWYVQATLALIKDLSGVSGVGADPDRIYFTGFSYGGKACWEFLRAGREVFAGAMCGAGWPIGRAYSRPLGAMKTRLTLEAARIKHIPIYIFAGEKDPMKYGSKAIDTELKILGAKVRYVEFPNTGHVATAGSIWRNRKYVGWLFKQNRKKNPAPGVDPHPKGVYDK
ncbi:MAG: hypothetical protein HN350_03625 [Phycisphaerales bacterium]|jgi:poly(3-hydroxybutyrate) depolymerase|nr:hypothetical protein [Phycisphaerales bacterium]